MIICDSVTKIYWRDEGYVQALSDISFELDLGQRVGLIGRNGAGKSTLIRLLGGAESPSRGELYRGMSVSWPLALRGGISPHLSGLANLRFLARIYGLPFEALVEAVESFSGLGDRLADSVSSYSSGMRAKFSFAVSTAIEFDCYLIDEVVAVGDKEFRRKCHRELVEKRGDRALLMVAHQANTIEEYCDEAWLLREGRLIDRFDLKLDRSWRKYV